MDDEAVSAAENDEVNECIVGLHIQLENEPASDITRTNLVKYKSAIEQLKTEESDGGTKLLYIRALVKSESVSTSTGSIQRDSILQVKDPKLSGHYLQEIRTETGASVEQGQLFQDRYGQCSRIFDMIHSKQEQDSQTKKIMDHMKEKSTSDEESAATEFKSELGECLSRLATGRKCRCTWEMGFIDDGTTRFRDSWDCYSGESKEGATSAIFYLHPGTYYVDSCEDDNKDDILITLNKVKGKNWEYPEAPRVINNTQDMVDQSPKRGRGEEDESGPEVEGGKRQKAKRW